LSATADYLHEPGLTRLWLAARERYEYHGGCRGAVRLNDLSEQEVEALAGLLPRGRQPFMPGGSCQVGLARLDELLRESAHRLALGEALETVHGRPLADRRAERAERERLWEALWQEAAGHHVCQSEPMRQWLEDLRRFGTLKQLAPGDERALLERALLVLDALPRDGTPRSQLASELFGNPHTLDSGEPLQTLVLGALAAHVGCPRPREAAGQREMWRAFGVLCDSLSCDVLTLGLRPVDESPSAQALRIDANAGRPERLTLQDLQLDQLEFQSGQEVFVCENPAVVLTAADQLGPACRPLVCTDGHPNTAVFVVLERLVECGARLRVRADFDWEGLRIAEAVADRFEAQPWRFDIETYSRLARDGAGPEMNGRKPRTSRWRALHAAMAELGICVYEEDVVSELLDDLDRKPADAVG
jgi:uncharacterized protein (TIGR02679 family)